jgi:hypothetical protein
MHHKELWSKPSKHYNIECEEYWSHLPENLNCYKHEIQKYSNSLNSDGRVRVMEILERLVFAENTKRVVSGYLMKIPKVQNSKEFQVVSQKIWSFSLTGLMSRNLYVMVRSYLHISFISIPCLLILYLWCIFPKY